MGSVGQPPLVPDTPVGRQSTEYSAFQVGENSWCPPLWRNHHASEVRDKSPRHLVGETIDGKRAHLSAQIGLPGLPVLIVDIGQPGARERVPHLVDVEPQDRKSTRLNSSH